jgi:lantibiotic modifying enzyme
MIITDKIRCILSDIKDQVTNNINLFEDPSVENGKMGLAIFYFYYHQIHQDDKYLVLAEQMIEDSVQLLSAISEKNMFTPKYRGDSLSNIISSFGKGLLFIENRFNYEYDFSEYYNAISETLIELNRQNFKRKDFDFFSGALAGGHFFLNSYFHKKDDISRQALLDISDSLVESAVYNNNNEVYWSAPSYFNYVYLGISHGSAMIINFMTKLFELKILNDDNVKEKIVLVNAVNFLLNRQRTVKDGYFPHYFLQKEEMNPTQFGLCYGDLGIAYTLFNVNKIIHNDSLAKASDFMLTSICQRKNDPQLTFDASIFYGAAGIFCVFDELFHKDGQIKYEDAAKYWYDQILTYRDDENESALRFIDSQHFKEDDGNKSANFSFGWGLAGVGICLMLKMKSGLPRLNETLLIGI